MKTTSSHGRNINFKSELSLCSRALVLSQQSSRDNSPRQTDVKGSNYVLCENWKKVETKVKTGNVI